MRAPASFSSQVSSCRPRARLSSARSTNDCAACGTGTPPAPACCPAGAGPCWVIKAPAARLPSSGNPLCICIDSHEPSPVTHGSTCGSCDCALWRHLTMCLCDCNQIMPRPCYLSFRSRQLHAFTTVITITIQFAQVSSLAQPVGEHAWWIGLQCRLQGSGSLTIASCLRVKRTHSEGVCDLMLPRQEDGSQSILCASGTSSATILCSYQAAGA